MAELRRTGVLFGTVVVIALALAAGSAEAQPRGKRGAKVKRAKLVKVAVDKELAAVAGGDVDRAAKAAELLGRAADRQAAMTGLIDALYLGLHPKVAAPALASLGAIGSAKALPAIQIYAHHRDRRVRAAAVAALGGIDDPRAVEAVLAALRDGHKDVRAAAVAVIGKRSIKRGIEPMMELLKKGDEAPAEALAAMADADLALALGELIGVAPDAALARAFGLILMRPSFQPEGARVQVVRTLGKIPGTEAIEQLTSYIESIPEKPPRQSRREAEALIEARLTGGN
jgi:HEAT repeat protein